MRYLLEVLIRLQHFIVFSFLIIFILFYSNRKSIYHNNVFHKSGLVILGTLKLPLKNLKDYFKLKSENAILLEENNKLKNILLNKPRLLFKDTTYNDYKAIPARIIKNSYVKPRNYLVLNKGTKKGIKKDMAVISHKGIIGIVNEVSENYSSVISILHLDLKINAKLKGTNVFGSLKWNSPIPNQFILSDISIINTISVGDTIVTGGMSSYFPENIEIGKISRINQTNQGNYYSADVLLFNNMTDQSLVYVIEKKDREEIIELFNLNK